MVPSLIRSAANVRRLDHVSARPRRARIGVLYGLSLVVLSAFPLGVGRAESLADGTTVRIRSTVIESGWHTGRLARDARSCSMIRLDRPTQAGYASLALRVVDALQLGRTGQWTAIDARRAIASEPAHCLAHGAD